MAPLQNGKTASASNIPTIQNLKHEKRSISYNATPEERTVSPEPDNRVDQAGCDQLLKASLMGILNSGEVKSDGRGRKVQNLLMETEKDWRKQRRQSRGERKTKAVLEMMEGKTKS
ncbi:uncharacterized protein BJX67DRAFT_343800 [Aspergillus lucknowensis]|uniref:Uncharacterized protein n=1 Tax=Aspergillus lucknowensis TaxID=176173 RepID=A0ABR4M3P8_9EURO